MKTYFDINAKDGVIVTSSFVESENADMHVTRKVDQYTGSADIAILTKVSEILKTITSDVELLLPEAVAIRIFTIRAAIKKGIQNVVASLIKDWMSAEYRQELSIVTPKIISAIENFSGKLVITKARTLYRWELTEKVPGALDKVNNKISLKGTGEENKGSWNEEKTIGCAENNYLNGEFTLVKQQVGKSTRYYVERLITIFVNGEVKKMTTLSAAATKGAKGANNTSSKVLNLIKLRTATAEKLPRTVTKEKVIVKDI